MKKLKRFCMQIYHCIVEYLIRNFNNTTMGGAIIAVGITGFGIGCSLSFDFTPVPFIIRLLAGCVFTVLLLATSFVGNYIFLGGRKKGFIIFALNFLCINGFLEIVCDRYEDQTMIIALIAAAIFDLFGRSLWAIIRFKRHSVTILVSCLSTMLLIGGMVYLIQSDGWSQSNIHLLYQLKQEEEASSSMTKSGQTINKQAFEEAIKPGLHKVETLEYGMKEDCDLKSTTYNIGKFASRKSTAGKVMDRYYGFPLSSAPIKGKIWYPAEQNNCPVLFIIHGNHQYTTPSYLGYGYLGEYLASNGYVVVSVDEDFCNQLSNENDARAIMLLESIKQVLQYNESEDTPLYQKINEDQIAIAGHSRGGEAVSTAYLFNHYKRYPGNGAIMFNYNFNIRSIIAIAQTVDQYMPANHEVALQDVNFLLIHGSNDQDVTTVMGNKQYNNITYQKSNDCFKSVLYVGGANHGQFNSRWGRYDLSFPSNYLLNVNDFITQDEQQNVLKIFTKIYLDVTLKKDRTNEGLFKDYRSYEEFLPKTVYQQMYMTSDFKVICDFDEDSELDTGTREGTTIRAGAIRVWKEVMTPGGRGGAGENYAQRIDWRNTKSASVTYNFTEVDASNRCIRFDLADLSSKTEVAGIEDCPDGLVIISDVNGISASARIRHNAFIYPSLAVQLHKMDSLNKEYQYKHQMQTVRIDDSIFLTDNPNIDMSKITSIMIKFDGSDEGSVKIDNIGTDRK